MSETKLPIDPVLPELISALRERGVAVLEAPPGAGKTSRVPLAIDEAKISAGKIVMLEPRRLAARAAAQRLAAHFGETPGGQVGYRMRGDTKVGPETRIEVVTEGILTRMIQSDPELRGIGTIIFDEFHERSLNGDLGLALALEIRGALREDLNLLAMSATLDAAPVAEIMGQVPMIRAEGRAFPVETIWLGKPPSKQMRYEAEITELVLQALTESDGGMLVFLPGAGEINRLAGMLEGRLPKDVRVQPLYGALPFATQQDAIRPLRSGRKLVLATSIAETSLTIEDIRVVVDGGRARRARYDPGTGMSRLVTEPVSRAEATQRQGRAGRVAAGKCFRFWTRAAEGALPAFPPSEIATADLAPLALELAQWGARTPEDLAFLTQPPEGSLANARALLIDLGALADDGTITSHGKDLSSIPLHPRLAHMLLRAGTEAAPLATLLGERDILNSDQCDLMLRLDAFRKKDRNIRIRPEVLKRLQNDSARLAKSAPKSTLDLSPAQMVALAYPDRIGLRRNGDEPRYVLSGGKGAVLPSQDRLANARLIVVADSDGNPREARIRQAIEISEAELRELFHDQITWKNTCVWSKRDRRVIAQREECLGAISLARQNWKNAPDRDVALAMIDGIRDLGLRFPDAAERFRARVNLARTSDPQLFPDMSDAALLEGLENWLLPHLKSTRDADGWARFDPLPALRAMLDWPQTEKLDRLVPAHFTSPLGRKIAIDYSTGKPEIAVRLQELFGLARHPLVAGTPLRITLLSPAGRPVQVTEDLPGFWASSYEDVRKDMRGRYPKHPWPESPLAETPTLRAKKRR